MKYLLLTLAMIFGTAQAETFTFNHRPITERLEREMTDRLKMAQNADAALSKMIARASEALAEEANKLHNKADRLQARGALWDAMALREQAIILTNAAEDFTTEWLLDYKGFIPRLVTLERETPELYTPMSTWLRDWYHTIKDLLGERVTTTLHLDDLQVINEGTPVILRFKSMGDTVPTASVFEQYWNPWTSCIAFWLTYIGCEAACWGMDIALLCSPIAMIAEETVYRYIAPRWSDKFYERIYK